MARRCSRATSRFTRPIQISGTPPVSLGVFLCFYLRFLGAAEAGLYSASDQVILLSAENVHSVLVNSSAAIVVEFYASWCGHCVAFSPVYKNLASDMKEWKPAVDLAVIDCASEENKKVCTHFGIKGYPTLKFFRAYSNANSTGKPIKGFSHNLRNLRHKIIDKLESHEDPWPPACPPLEPISQMEVDSFFENNNVRYLALIFEDPKSYIGREVTLDLLHYDNIAVRRVLSSEESLVNKLGVTSFPSCYILSPGGNFTRLKVIFEARTFYSMTLLRLPGVVRSGTTLPVTPGSQTNVTKEPWRPFNRSRVYMADLESALHYSLRVEISGFQRLKGEMLTSFKNYISVLAKYFPGRPMVMNLLKSVHSWLQNTATDVSYQALREILDNSAQSPNTALPEGVKWVGCQGSQPRFRGYPCGLWTLFHVLTVQANSEGSEPKEVLEAMSGYIQSFFGCRECAGHFGKMVKEGLGQVFTLSSSIMWLWSRHNRVNNRLAGALSEDPQFPKIQWPDPEMCPSCHSVKRNGEHAWNETEVLAFLRFYFSKTRILTDYLEDENHVLDQQRQKHVSQQPAVGAQRAVARKAREVMVQELPSQDTVQEEEEEDEEPEEEEEEGGEGEGKVSEPPNWAKPTEEVTQGRQKRHRVPVIVGMKLRDVQEDIVDLDSFVDRHYKAKAMELAASTRVKQRSLQRKEEQEPVPGFELGVELDPVLGMMRLQPVGSDASQQGKRLHKRDLAGQYIGDDSEDQEFNKHQFLSHRGRWISGFSKVDISLCVVLYFLSSMCLLAMYLFFKTRLRVRRAKLSMP